MPEDVFWGPGYTEAFIETLEEVDFWQDDVFGEGGIGLNKDERVMTYFGCDALAWGEIAELYNEIVMAWWAELGWTVRCVAGTPDIAESVGQPRSVATAAPVGPWPVEPDRIGEQWADGQWVFGLVSTSADDHRGCDVGARSFLTAGPIVFEHLDALPALQEVIEHHATRPLKDWEVEKGRRGPLTNDLQSGIFFDRERQKIEVFAETLSEEDLAFNRENVWPGWTITQHHDGFAGHFDRVGVEAPTALLEPPWWGDDVVEPVVVTEADLLNQIHEQLLGPRSDPTAFMSKVVADTMKDGEDIWVNPHAMVSPTDPRPSDDECEAIFARAIRAMAKSRKTQA